MAIQKADAEYRKKVLAWVILAMVVAFAALQRGRMIIRPYVPRTHCHFQITWGIVCLQEMQEVSP